VIGHSEPVVHGLNRSTQVKSKAVRPQLLVSAQDRRLALKDK
jgi:hypothetical protein